MQKIYLVMLNDKGPIMMNHEKILHGASWTNNIEVEIMKDDQVVTLAKYKSIEIAISKTLIINTFYI